LFSDAWNADLNILLGLSDLCGLLFVHCLPKHMKTSLVLLVLEAEKATSFGK